LENIINKFKFKNEGRIFYLDQLRALAIIGVIGIHISAAYLVKFDPNSFNWIISGFFAFFTRFAVPIFLMLSGALLLNKEYKILEFIKKRYPRIIIPFLFWGVIYVIFAILFQNKASYFSSLSTAIPFIVKMFLGVQGYLTHFWYVWLILSVYLLFPIINKWIKNSSFSEIKYFLGIWFITSIFVSFNIPYYNINLSYFAGPIGFVILGYYLSNKTNKILGNIFLWPILFLISTLLRVWTLFDLSISANHLVMASDIYSALSVIQATSMFLMIKNFNDNQIFTKAASILKNGIIGNLTVSLSRYSYGIYLIHVLFLKFFIIFGLSFANKSAIKWIPFLVIVILLLSWGTLAILNRIPLINKITGMH